MKQIGWMSKMTNLELINKIKTFINKNKYNPEIQTEYGSYFDSIEIIDVEDLIYFLTKLENEMLVETSKNILEEHKDAFKKLSE